MSEPLALAEGILRAAAGDRVRIAFLAPLTSFRLGGPAALYLEPESDADLAAAGEAIVATDLPFVVIGKGSNILVSDAGFPGLVLRLGHGYRWVAREGERLTAGGSIPLPALAGVALRHGLAGLEFGVAIPATLGGAVRMNAGAHGGSMADVLERIVTYRLRDGRVETVKAEDAGFAYRRSALAEDAVVTGGVVRLANGDATGIRARMDEAREWRRRTQPLAEPNCGSVFANPEGDHAARLIDTAGGKGRRVGGASVSMKHANFIVAEPGARSSDVLTLIRDIQRLVEDTAGIALEPEVKLIERSMKPDAKPVTDTDTMDADPAQTEVSDQTEVSGETAPSGSATTPRFGTTEVVTSEPPPDPPEAGRHDRMRKIVAIVFIATVLLGAAAVTLTRSPFFYAREIEIRGTSHVARADVLRIAAITPTTNVFTLDAGAAEARLERDPWIAGATITKDLPSRLTIDIHERVAVAVVESGGVLRLVADDGALLEAALPRVSAGLPVIAFTDPQGIDPAADAVGGAARAIGAMVPTLRQRIDGVSILADGQLRVDLSSGAEVAYGEAVDLPEKAMALGALLDYAAGKGASVISADVRVPSAPTAVLSGGDVVAP